ncbi:MAG TPA: TolC family protein [Candidatus Hypogeohydataceae bacterium YC41]
MSKILRLFSLFCLTILMPITLHAEGVEFQAELGYLRLSLTDCIEMAFRNNLDVEIARFNPRIGDKDISIARARFDPVVNATAEIRKDETPLNSIFITGFAPVEFDNNKKLLDATLSTLTPTGATLSVNYDTLGQLRFPAGFISPDTQSITGTVIINGVPQNNIVLQQLLGTSRFVPTFPINPSFDSFFEAKVTQPLLKGFGIFYNMAPIYIARNNKKKSIYALKQTLSEVANNTQKAYWDLVNAIGDLKAANKSLQRAEEFYRRNKLQVDAGTLAPIELVAAEEEVAARQQLIIVAENNVKNKEDTLKQFMNLIGPAADPVLMDSAVIPLDTPQFLPKKISLENALQVAMERRPELFENRLNLENTEIAVKQKKNELLPKLDLEGGVRYSGLGKRWNDSTNSTWSYDFQGEYTRLTLSVPLGLRSERANYAKAKFARRQAELTLQKVERDILVQVRAAVRQVNTNIERVLASRKTRELAEKRLDAEVKKFNVGRSIILEVFRAQEALTIAEVAENKSITDFQSSLGELELAKGTMLEYYGVVLEGQLGY